MKRILLIALLVVGCVLTERTENNHNDTIVGTWSLIEVNRTTIVGDLVEATTETTDENHYSTYIFSSDGSYQSESYDDGEVDTGIGEWSITNSNQLTIITQVNNQNSDIITEFIISYYFSLDINTLILSSIEDYEHGITHGMVFTYQKSN